MPALTFDDATHTYYRDGAPVPLSVTGVLMRAIHPSTLRPLVNFSGIPFRTLEAAKERGRRVHAAVHYLNQHDLDWPSVDNEDIGYLRSWLTLLDVRRFRCVLCEHRVLSLKHDVAGTIDVIGHFEDSPTIGILGDFKTGEPEDVAADLQTGAYHGIACEWQAYDETLRRVLASYRTIVRLGFQLVKDGRLPKIAHFATPSDYRTFLSYHAQVTAPFLETSLP